MSELLPATGGRIQLHKGLILTGNCFCVGVILLLFNGSVGARQGFFSGLPANVESASGSTVRRPQPAERLLQQNRVKSFLKNRFARGRPVTTSRRPLPPQLPERFAPRAADF